MTPIKQSTNIATGLATASSAKKSRRNIANGAQSPCDLAAQLVTQAVGSAMQKADITVASSVLLFLTSEFANDPQSAIKAAAKTANCTQIIGCSATGIFTEEDWIIDSPAAAAMVFSGGINLCNVREPQQNQLMLTLTAPNAINTTWLNDHGVRFGGVSGDAIGHGPFSVWENGKGTVQGRCEVKFQNTQGAVAASHGLRFLNIPALVTSCTEHDVMMLNQTSAWKSLQTAWQKHYGNASLPMHQLIAVYSDSLTLIEKGQYNLGSLIACDEVAETVTLAKVLTEQQWLCWAIRDEQAAADDFKTTAKTLGGTLNNVYNTTNHQATTPDFGLLFSCLGRGPYLYDGQDKDLLILRELYPNMPFIGFYGNGEIAPINGKNELLQYSAVLGLFKENTRNNSKENIPV